METRKFGSLRKSLLQIVFKEKSKEYYCHVQFVVQIALQLAQKYRVNLQLIEVAALLHDIGRDKEVDSEDHGDAGERIASTILIEKGFSKLELDLILNCIKNHNKKNISNLSLEEKIIITADSSSKVIFHEAFMLMCKKTTYQERLAWGLKYLEKGYKNIQFPDFKVSVKPKYNELLRIYQSVK